MPAALSLAPLYLLGLGAFALYPLLGRMVRRTARSDVAATAALLANGLGFGILANYCLVLIAGSLQVAEGVGCALATVGCVLAARAWSRRPEPRPDRPRTSWWFGLALAVVIALNAVLILALPLRQWDARSIWFFQAKIIHFAGALSSASPWAEFGFAHADYPKLLPVLAAQVAGVAGFWNEVLPKAALLVLLVPAALGYFATLTRPLSWGFLVAMVFLPTWPLLWNGYADGYFALYAGLGVLHLSRLSVPGRRLDALLGTVWLAIAACLKNEGLLLLGSVALASLFAAGASTSRRAAFAAKRDRDQPTTAGGGLPAAALLSAAVVCAAPLLWYLKRSLWGLESDLGFSAQAVATAWGRLEDGDSLALIAKHVFATHELAGVYIPLALAWIAARGLGVRVPDTVRVPIATAALYAAGLVAVYLMTPHDLIWHLDTSADRTVLPIFVILSVAAFAILEAIEVPVAAQVAAAPAAGETT